MDQCGGGEKWLVYGHILKAELTEFVGYMICKKERENLRPKPLEDRISNY